MLNRCLSLVLWPRTIWGWCTTLFLRIRQKRNSLSVSRASPSPMLTFLSGFLHHIFVCGEITLFRLVEWVEMVTALGAEKIFIYNLEVHPNITKVQTVHLNITKVQNRGWAKYDPMCNIARTQIELVTHSNLWYPLLEVELNQTKVSNTFVMYCIIASFPLFEYFVIQVFDYYSNIGVMDVTPLTLPGKQPNLPFLQVQNNINNIIFLIFYQFCQHNPHFLDAIASHSIYPCQWVSQSVQCSEWVILLIFWR